MYKDHQPIIIDEFNGLYKRGHPDNTPLDHFQDCDNIQITPGGDVNTRDGIDISQDVSVPLSNIARIYNYPTNTGNTLLVLTYVGGVGFIYHVINSTTVYGPVLSVAGMSDFAFVPYGGRAYISPFTTYPVGGLNVEKGLPNEWVYVYAGDGSLARKTAGQALVGTLTIANGIAGHTDAGLHIFGIVGETLSGYLTAPGALTTFTTSSGSSVSFGNVPVGQTITHIIGQFIPAPLNINYDTYEPHSLFTRPPDILFLEEDELTDEDPINYRPDSRITIENNPYLVRRHLVASKVITNYNGDTTGYKLYFVPNAIIENNTNTFLNNISFYDQDLIDDASYLFDNFSEIPAGAVMSMYHNRMGVYATYDHISSGYLSTAGEPEAIDQINGLVEVPPDGNPITNAQELRDVLYVTKRSRTISFIDNGDDPATWPLVQVDNALGSFVHGIATVLDSGAANIDFLIVATYQGISLFNGRYISPELTWKIEDYWKALSRPDFRLIQIVNAPIQKKILIVLPNGKILVGDYSQGMDSKKIRWYPWSYSINVNCIAIWNISEIIIGANE